MSGNLRLDPLFLGLTRPAMILGVSFMYFVLNLLIGVVTFITTSSFKVVPVSVIIHLLGMMLAKKEPLAIEMLMLKMQKFNRCPNRVYHGGKNSYDMF
ncbi:VirB3 family type IV secretion system protein [Candidatus Deianiraea vastatrix]|uniref:Type IV secretion system protein VirB3 n=1 Tax=Candidatus Deianiraea vastatrix TaxID=2163644 RepID=A0A5B8XF92_9RICK|nr:VirB3 family type IV secretion system protein [Candidatus Deianiraea vastatrix]QED23595.1 Type IV secretion system protein VirB3 [Candidatus Deianiraea vastatrix]